MRIRDLFEHIDIDKDKKFVKKTGDKTELNFDLIEDVSFFMHHDDDSYRRHVYPSVVRCLERLKKKQPTNHSIFEKAVRECYKSYVRKFPMRELPDDLNEAMCTKICKKLHSDLQKDVQEGKYKD
jgi:hypothetical protein